jgi:hypothetical protein
MPTSIRMLVRVRMFRRSGMAWSKDVALSR